MPKINRKIWLPIVVWFSLFIFTFNIANYFQDARHAAINAVYETFINCMTYYFTTLVLFPRFYKNVKGYFWISLLSIIILGLLFFLIDVYFIPNTKNPDPDRPPIFFHFMRYFFNLGFVYFVATTISFMDKTTKLKEAEKVLTEEKLETELKLLKAQINPHFIFNALNNIYSLTYMQSKNAPNSVLKLSEMLRYVFYDCSKDRVPLSAELKYIENFTAFQQMKSEFTQNIRLQTEVNVGTIEIAPMLFIPFIENAFKYSRIEEHESALVDIQIKHRENNLQFIIENSIAENKPGSGSGMGIKNVEHRLDIIYPGKYELKIEKEVELFRVDLSLKG
jgi:hypothetical protein